MIYNLVGRNEIKQKYLLDSTGEKGILIIHEYLSIFHVIWKETRTVIDNLYYDRKKKHLFTFCHLVRREDRFQMALQ